MHAAVFLDRDNTLIHNEGDLGEPDAVRLIQGAASAVASLRGLGYRVVVVTNQGGVARGKYAESAVEAVHRRINELVKATSGATIDRFYYCPYHPEATVVQYRREHPWRKPQAGMLLQAAQDLHLDLSLSWMVGDQMRDIAAGAAAGCRTILLRPDAEELTPLRIEQLGQAPLSSEVVEGVMPHFTARNLVEAVRIIAQQRKPETPEELRARERERKKWDPASVRAARAAGSTEGRASTTAVGEGAAMVAPARPSRTLRLPGDASPARPPSAVAAPPADGATVEACPPEALADPASAAEAAAPASPPPNGAAATGHDRPPTAAPGRPDADVAAPTSADHGAPQRTSPLQTDSLAADQHAVLHQILQELRHQRATREDFTAAKVTAIVLQIIAAVCLLAGLLMGSETDQWLRWLGAALLLQLATLAALLWQRG